MYSSAVDGEIVNAKARLARLRPEPPPATEPVPADDEAQSERRQIHYISHVYRPGASGRVRRGPSTSTSALGTLFDCSVPIVETRGNWAKLHPDAYPLCQGSDVFEAFDIHRDGWVMMRMEGGTGAAIWAETDSRATRGRVCTPQVQSALNSARSGADTWSAGRAAAAQQMAEFVLAEGQAVGLPLRSTEPEPQPGQLWEAANSGDARRVKQMLAAGADVNDRSSNAMNPRPLFIAARSGYTEVVRALLASGADYTVRNSKGADCLMPPAQSGHVDIVRALLEAGMAVDNTNTEGSTSLCMAAQNGHVAVARVLLAAGASRDHRCMGRTPFQWAKFKGHREMMALLR
eukprot:COSAG04_NODE_4756_length_1907_cov_2.646018_1_plen_347_part_00